MIYNIYMESNVIDRVEKKYLINKAQKKAFLEKIQQHMREDGYHKSEVINLYFDTDNYDFIIQSIDQPVFKEKLRARSYGGYDRVFLEVKTKLRGKEYNVGYKRRVMITRSDYVQLAKGDSTVAELASKSVENKNDIQIAKEVDYLIEKFNLKPKIMVMYNRESYKGDDNLRITFDEKLKYRTNNLSFNKAKRGKMYFKDNRNIIMEVKAHGVLPLWLARTMSENKAFPQQFSKVGKIYAKIRKEENV